MSDAALEQAAHPLDLAGMAVFAANYGLSGEQSARRWATAVKDVREHFRMVADAAIMAGSLTAQPAPELAEPVTVEGVLCRDYPAVVAAMQAAGDRRLVTFLRVEAERNQYREQVRNLRDALEHCRDAAGRSPAAVHTIASQALASNPS